jgi:transcriptional regulator with XRE-family HTH domain
LRVHLIAVCSFVHFVFVMVQCQETCTVMENLSLRLKEERLRLKLTQAGFAEACGVKRRAQAAYESGDRVPDAEYLVRAARAGADLKYLLTGVLSSDAERERMAVEWLIREVGSALGINAAAVEHTIGRAASIDASPPDEFGKQFAMTAIATDLLRQSRRLNAAEVPLQLDRDLLADVVREQEEAWARTGKQPSPLHKSHRFASLYADAAERGEVNAALVEGGVVRQARRSKLA